MEEHYFEILKIHVFYCQNILFHDIFLIIFFYDLKCSDQGYSS